MSQPGKLVIPSRVLREIGAVLGLVVLFLLAMFCQHWHEAREEVAEAVAETNQRDPGWRIEDLEAQRQLPAPEQNSALQVLAVKPLLPRLWRLRPAGPPGENRNWVWDVLRHDRPPQCQLNEPQTRQLRADLERFGPALAEARKLVDMPEGRYPLTWTADVGSTQCPWSDALDSARDLLRLDAVLRGQDNEADAALISARALLNVGRSLGEEPFFRAPEERLGCRFDAVGTIERTLAQGQPSEATLAATQDAVRDEESVPLFLLHFRGDRTVKHWFLTEVDNGNHRLSEAGCVPSRGVRSHLETWFYRPDAMHVHARYLQAMNEAVEIARLPLEEQAPRYQLWRKEYGHVENVGNGLTGPGWTEAALLTGHARLRCALIALAAERYRRQHAAWPQSLADLVPQYLKAVPLDPFDGKPLRYRRTDSGAVGYSVGEDAHDDGGDLNRPPNGGAPRDIVFTLWNVDQRRQLPKPPEQGDADRR
jgi:hypothetical protein